MKHIDRIALVLSVFIASVILISGPTSSAFPTGTNLAPVKLSWISPRSYADPTNTISFNVYTTDTMSAYLTNWSILTNVWATNVVTTNIVDETNYEMCVFLKILPGQHYFTVTSSNFWESDFFQSNTVSSPPVPKGSGLNISR